MHFSVVYLGPKAEFGWLVKRNFSIDKVGERGRRQKRAGVSSSKIWSTNNYQHNHLNNESYS